MAESRKRPDLKTTYQSATTPTEEALTKICLEVLSIDKIGINDSFMDLNLNSLEITKLLVTVSNRLQTELTFDAIFNKPTIAEMAKEILTLNPNAKYVE